MAKNFSISASRQNNSLHLQLRGDFDGTSACELLNVLKEMANNVAKVCINTKGLKDIHRFGVDTFQNSLYPLKGRPFRLVFTGEHAFKIAPERNKFF